MIGILLFKSVMIRLFITNLFTWWFQWQMVIGILLFKSAMIRLFITNFLLGSFNGRCCSQADYHSFVRCCI